MSENYILIEEIAVNDVSVLMDKGKTYGSSWRNRGGVGAFMMLARKWDRIENICKKSHYDIFDVCLNNNGEILDDIADLRRYLLLVEAHVTNDSALEISDAVKCGATARYVDQDGRT